jgi:hypothetical protein
MRLVAMSIVTVVLTIGAHASAQRRDVATSTTGWPTLGAPDPSMMRNPTMQRSFDVGLAVGGSILITLGAGVASLSYLFNGEVTSCIYFCSVGVPLFVTGVVMLIVSLTTRNERIVEGSLALRDGTLVLAF